MDSVESTPTESQTVWQSNCTELKWVTVTVDLLTTDLRENPKSVS